MPNDFRIRAGSLVATYTFPGTDIQWAAILRRFARSLGISIEGTNQENLQAILDHYKDDTIRGSKAVQLAEKRAAAEAQLLAEVEIDNPQ